MGFLEERSALIMGAAVGDCGEATGRCVNGDGLSVCCGSQVGGCIWSVL
jgi:hypothetical protein